MTFTEDHVYQTRGGGAVRIRQVVDRNMKLVGTFEPDSVIPIKFNWDGSYADSEHPHPYDLLLPAPLDESGFENDDTEFVGDNEMLATWLGWGALFVIVAAVCGLAAWMWPS